MATRYTDFDAPQSDAADFVIRKRYPTSALLIVAFVISLLFAIVLANAFEDKMRLGVFLFMTFCAVGAYTVITLQRNHDLVLTTEFQNALFASALGLNNKFCIIIRRDGNISYLDRGFREMFPNFLKQSQRGIAVLLDLGRVSKEDNAKIFNAIEHGVFDRIIFNINDSKGIPHKIVMSVEPIVRPSGFILLRGREFVEQRNKITAEAIAPTPTLLSKNNVTLFSYVMDSMNMGIYMAGPAGNIIYVNPVLEQWLDYGEGEINAGKSITLNDIIFQADAQSDTIEPQNFEGEVVLLKKTGGQAKAFISQKVIRDDNGVNIGCTAIVHGLNDHYAEMKKKLW